MMPFYAIEWRGLKCPNWIYQDRWSIEALERPNPNNPWDGYWRVVLQAHTLADALVIWREMMHAPGSDRSSASRYLPEPFLECVESAEPRGVIR